DAKRRSDIKIHHSTAHLLQSALIKILGDGIAQAGSQVEPTRTRFDFTFDRAVSKDEIQKVEKLLNEWISQDLKCETQEMSIDEAKKSGAIALFDEKYTDKVRVVTIKGVSKELCGGTHVNSTGEIRLAKIISEGAVAAGTRRIEVICGDTALKLLLDGSSELEKISQSFKAPTNEAFSKVEKLLDENKKLQNKLKMLEEEIAMSKVNTLINEALQIEGGKLLVVRLDGLTSDILKASIEKLADKLGNSIILMASLCDEKISIISKISDNFIKAGFNAGQLVNEVASFCEGKGGGRPNFAQAGAKNPQNLDRVLLDIRDKICHIG
ncbi:MAG: DHHA1 domain-containing protein, partial [Candidatus Gastranaerophilaceae bacterium]